MGDAVQLADDGLTLPGAGLGGTSLPDIKARVVLDDSQLQKAGTTAGKTGAAIESAMKNSTTHTLRFQQSLTTLLDHFGGMPPIVNEAGRSLESMASQGVTGMGLLAGGALVAVGAVAEVVKSSAGAYQSIGDNVENFRRVTGATADESSRLVHVFTDLGVAPEVATAGMFKLSKAIETVPQKLEALNITVARDAAGNVNLSKTLYAVADAYNATADPAKRNLILFDAFGKSGADMIPILEQGSAALQKMEASASLLFSEADLERLKQAKIHSQEVKSAWEEFWAGTVGKTATEQQDNWAQATLADAYAAKQLDDAVANGTLTAQQRLAGGARLIQHYRDEYYASQKTKEGADALSQSLQDQAAATAALAKQIDDVINKQEAQVNAGFALQQADLAVAESQLKVNQAGEAWRAAVAKYGSQSDEALLAGGNWTRALIEQERAYYADAAAAEKVQEDTDLAATGQRDAAKEAQVYIDKLQAEANTLAPDSPLRIRLQAYIDKLKNEIPRDITTRLHLLTPTQEAQRAAGGHGTLEYAAGGRPPVGPIFMVGEHGPELMRLDQPATVYPHGVQPPGTGGGGDSYSITVNAQTNADPYEMASELGFQVKRLRRRR